MGPGQHTPVHWGLNRWKAVGRPYGSDSRYTASMVTEQVVPRTCSHHDGTLGCRAVEQVYHRRRTTLSRAEWLGSTFSRFDEETDGECVGLHLKQQVFPKHDHHQQLV